ncbi:MAG TPA: DinB family protein [Bryobacteraceae bacterium]|jgi:uncharacterized damage-inducible protein DinB
MAQPEPWLRGKIDGLDPARAHLLYTFEQAREELEAFCSALTIEELWALPHPRVASVGFQLRHIAGSVDRLTTYLRGEQLTGEQLVALKAEQEPSGTFADLMTSVEAAFARTEAVVRSLTLDSLTDSRFVGRRQLPTSVGGLIIHISEHTQRHLGQAVLTAKLVRTFPSPAS